MSFQRIYVLAVNFPDDSPLHKKVLGPEEYQWTGEMRMLASIHEQVQWVGWVMGQLNAHRYKGNKNPIPEPQPIPRPGIDPKQQKAKRKAKPGGMVFGAKPESESDAARNQAALRTFFGRDGKKTGR